MYNVSYLMGTSALGSSSCVVMFRHSPCQDPAAFILEDETVSSTALLTEGTCGSG